MKHGERQGRVTVLSARRLHNRTNSPPAAACGNQLPWYSSQRSCSRKAELFPALHAFRDHLELETFRHADHAATDAGTISVGGDVPPIDCSILSRRTGKRR